MSVTREKILTAFTDILVEDGERAATFDAIAARANLSKGGLIYHFASKESMVDALCDQLDAFIADDIEAMKSDDSGPMAYYIHTSRFADTSLDRLLIAVTKLEQANFRRARGSMELASSGWLRVLTEVIGDLQVAKIVKLIGDGLYFEALFSDESYRTVRTDEDEEQLLAVLARILPQ